MEETVALTTAPSTVAPSTATISAAASPIIPSPALFQVGTVVEVLDRTWIGRNDQGGVARIIKVRPNGEDGDNDGCTKYDVKYVLGGRELLVDECFIKCQDFDENMAAARRQKLQGRCRLVILKYTTLKRQNNNDAMFFFCLEFVLALFETADINSPEKLLL